MNIDDSKLQVICHLSLNSDKEEILKSAHVSLFSLHQIQSQSSAWNFNNVSYLCKIVWGLQLMQS